MPFAFIIFTHRSNERIPETCITYDSARTAEEETVERFEKDALALLCHEINYPDAKGIRLYREQEVESKQYIVVLPLQQMVALIKKALHEETVDDAADAIT